FDEQDLTTQTYNTYPGAEFYYADTNYFIAQSLFDTGTTTYSAYTVSTRLENYELVQQLLNTVVEQPISLSQTLVVEQNTREVVTEDNRLAFDIPTNWVY